MRSWASAEIGRGEPANARTARDDQGRDVHCSSSLSASSVRSNRAPRTDTREIMVEQDAGIAGASFRNEGGEAVKRMTGSVALRRRRRKLDAQPSGGIATGCVSSQAQAGRAVILGFGSAGPCGGLGFVSAPDRFLPAERFRTRTSGAEGPPPRSRRPPSRVGPADRGFREVAVDDKGLELEDLRRWAGRHVLKACAAVVAGLQIGRGSGGLLESDRSTSWNRSGAAAIALRSNARAAPRQDGRIRMP